MKILISGKGGTGKTTVAALLAMAFASNGYNVLALDADSVPNLALSLGVPPEVAENIVPLSKNEELAEERTGARPGEGWGVLFSLTPRVDDIAEKYGITISDNLKLVVVGSIDASKEGCMCPAIALARAFLLHVMMRRGDVVVVDSEAGAEVFGRGLAEKFEFNLTVAEPTVKSLSIARKLLRMAGELGVSRNILVLNKVKDNLKALQLTTKVFGSEAPQTHIVRFDENVVKADEEGRGLNTLPRNSPAREDVFHLMTKLTSISKRPS